MKKQLMFINRFTGAKRFGRRGQLYLCLLLSLAFFLFACKSDDDSVKQDSNSGLQSDNDELNTIFVDAEKLLEQNRVDDAVEEYDKAVEDFPKEAATFVGRGRAYTAQEEYSDAEADFDYAISLDESFAPAYLERGIMWRNSGEFKAAADDFDHALELNPAYSDVHVSRGVMYELQGDPAAAFKSYGQAIQLDPNNTAAYRNRGMLLFSVFFDDPSALADFNRALEIDDTDINALISRTLYYIAQEDWAAAQADIDRAFDLDTKAAPAYAMRALIGQELGNSTGVLEDFDRAVKIDPDYWQGYQLRMMYYLEQEEWRSALNDAERVVELEADDQALAYAYYIQGLIYETEFEDALQARDAYEKAVDLLPDDAFLNLTLATLYNYYLEDVNNAIIYYDRVIELEPGNADAYFGRGVAYLYFEIPNDERPISDFSQYLRLVGDSNPQQVKLAQEAIDQLTVTLSDVLLNSFAEGFFEGLFNPVPSSNTGEEPYLYVQRQYYDPRTGSLQDTYCSGCSQTTTAIEVP